MKNEKKYTCQDIKTLSKTEWLKLRLLDPAEIDPIYVIIGFLQEYFGGYSLHEETVDMFFVNEFEKAKTFKKLCEFYLTSINRENDVEFIKTETGHSYVQSKTICQKLKEHYTVREPDFINHQCYTLPKDNDLFKSVQELYQDDSKFFNFKKLSFLYGVIIKNKIENQPSINFPNAGHKADLTIEFLRSFDAFGDKSLKVEYYFNIPHITRISLTKENPIWNKVKKYEEELIR